MKQVVSIENLSKHYVLGTRGTGTFVHDLNRWFINKTGKHDPYFKIGEQPIQKEFWALKDINFVLNEGDILGVIGKNGAGKSTLLKILSKITKPTSGRIRIKGKLSSLLEVGTGFHPELTGRENIYLNGAILGMSKAEINAKFDEIIDFSAISQFIDTPVKRYSSGMYVRLAFSVAAHLSADIIVIDEVLAVGDAEFQKKCIGKIKEVSQTGRTLIFVSHNMTAVKSLCNKGIVLNQGSMEGGMLTANQAVSEYFNSLRTNNKSFSFSDQIARKGNGKALFTRIAFIQNGSETAIPQTGEQLVVRLYFLVKHFIKHCFFAISFNTTSGENKILLSSELINKSFQYQEGEHFVDCEIGKNPLQSGDYIINIFLKSNNDIVDWIQDAVVLEIAPGDFYGTGRVIDNGNSSVLIQQDWN